MDTFVGNDTIPTTLDFGFGRASLTFAQRVPDHGHESPQELAAAKELYAYALAAVTTDRGSKDAVVQMMGANTQAVVAWVNFGKYDKLAVKVDAAGTMWKPAISLEDALQPGGWRGITLSSKSTVPALNHHAVAVDEIIRRHFPKPETQICG